MVCLVEHDISSSAPPRRINEHDRCWGSILFLLSYAARVSLAVWYALIAATLLDSSVSLSGRVIMKMKMANKNGENLQLKNGTCYCTLA